MKHPQRLPLILLVLLFLGAAPGTALFAQATNAHDQLQKREPSTTSPSCTRDSALQLVYQQIDATRTFDDAVARITALLRAADLLWPHQKDRARATFSEAFDLATANFKEKGDKDRVEGVGLVSGTPDQRYTVISAIARRDYQWARKLTDQVLKEDADEAKEKAADDPQHSGKAAGKILGIAFTLLPSDVPTAINIARTSLSFPATLMLPMFLYRVAETDQSAADQFYGEALAAYRDKPMGEFLYLSAYPFGNRTEAGEMPGYTIYRIPPNFTPNVSLERLFVQTLIQRARQAFENPSDTEDIRRVTENGQIWLAFTRLEKQIQQSLPDLLVAAQQAKASSFSVQSQKSQGQVTKTINDQERPMQTFDQRVEAADKQRDPDRRNYALASAVTSAPLTEPFEHVLSAAEKIDDSQLRDQVLNWFYFTRAQNTKQLDEARRLAGLVSELDQRAFLYSGIAQEAIKHTESQQQAREILEEVLSAANKAPNNTMATARTLLAVAYLYTKIDPGRAMSTLSEAIKCINRIEAPDFSRQNVFRKIEIKTFGIYASFQTPGFSPENVFREVGKLDLDGALYQSSNLTNKGLHSLTTLALIDDCLKQSAPPAKLEKTPARSQPKKAP
jgi:hypothetical protein